jgi:hypothetical protein
VKKFIYYSVLVLCSASCLSCKRYKISGKGSLLNSLNEFSVQSNGSYIIEGRLAYEIKEINCISKGRYTSKEFIKKINSLSNIEMILREYGWVVKYSDENMPLKTTDEVLIPFDKFSPTLENVFEDEFEPINDN